MSEFSVHLLHTLSEITIVPLEEFFGIVVFHRLNIHQLLVVINLSLSLFLLSCKQGPAGLLWVLKLVDIDYLWSDGVPEVFFEEISLVEFILFVYLFGFMFTAVTTQLFLGQLSNRVINVCHLCKIEASFIDSPHVFSETAYS